MNKISDLTGEGTIEIMAIYLCVQDLRNRNKHNVQLCVHIKSKYAGLVWVAVFSVSF